MALTIPAQRLQQRLREYGELAATAEGRGMIVERIERSIRRSHMGSAMLDKVKLMYAYFCDSAEPIKPKLLIGGALLYLVIPTDLIPDWVALVGFTDDFAAIAIIWKQLQDILLNYEERRRERVALTPTPLPEERGLNY